MLCLSGGNALPVERASGRVGQLYLSPDGGDMIGQLSIKDPSLAPAGGEGCCCLGAAAASLAAFLDASVTASLANIEWMLRVAAALAHRRPLWGGPYSRHWECCVCCDWPAALLSVFVGVAAVDEPHLTIVWSGFICFGLRHYAVGDLTPCIRLIL